MKISSNAGTCTGRGPGLLHLNSIICSMRISPVIFLKVFFRVKTSEVEEIVAEKWYNRWLDLQYLPACYCPGRIYIAWSLWYFGDFRNIFLPNIVKDKMNVLPFEHTAPGTVPYSKIRPWLLHYVHKKVR